MTKSVEPVKLSIRLMTYMHEPFIKEAMDGIMKQKTNFKIEVVVGDDFSTDRTLELIRSYENTDKIHIKILKRTKGDVYWKKRKELGRFYNFINILKNCKGEYIALLDGDDYWSDPLKLQKQVDFLEANADFVGVFHNVGYIDERQSNGQLTPWRNYTEDVFTAKDTIREFSLFHSSSYCFRNLDYDLEILLSNKKVVSGDMLLLGIISKFGKLKLLEGLMSVYRKNEGGLTSNETQLEYHRNRIALNKVLNTYFDKRYNQLAQNLINYHKDEVLKLNAPRLYYLKKRLSAFIN